MTVTDLAHTARPRSRTGQRTAARLAYVDNLRLLLAALVVAHHVGQAYGPTGGEWPVFNPTRAAILGPFFAVNAAFFMGLFFLIAGYFAPAAYDRKGGGAFLKDRLLRLGLPLLVVALVLIPLAKYVIGGGDEAFGAYLASYYRQPEVAHMWFTGALILFGFGYALWRALPARRHPAAPALGQPPGNRAILGFTLGLALVTFLVRLAFPVDRWIHPAPLVRLEPAHLPQYLGLFVVGILAYRRQWLERLPAGTGLTWLAIGLAAAALTYGATLFKELTGIDLQPFSGGGLSLEALGWSLLEAFICVGLCVGLLTLFREHGNRQGRRLATLAAASYAVYVLHLFPVVLLQEALAPAPLPPLAKFAAVTALALPLCFLLAVGLRKLPGVRQLV